MKLLGLLYVNRVGEAAVHVDAGSESTPGDYYISSLLSLISMQLSLMNAYTSFYRVLVPLKEVRYV